MSAWPSFTVAILSHRRPKLLCRVIGAVAQLDYPEFEIVVVGDLPDIAGYGLDPAVARQIRYRHLAEANISRGRNLALSMAAGDVVAFCDDDAAPEPNWLRALAGAFRRPDVAAASGTVLAADGLTVEWQGRIFTSAGRDWAAVLPHDGILYADAYTQTTDNRYLGLIGVNSAFRRIAALQAGGFDEAYVYFLEETDMAIRLARGGWAAALVPGAVVHHLREQNASRTATQVPRDLYQVAASRAHFCRRHMAAGRLAAELDRFRETRLRRLDPYVRLGALRADGLRKLERQLDRGLKEGAERVAVLPLSPALPLPPLARFHRPGPSPGLRIALVTGWGALRIARLRRLARRLALDGHMVSCFSYISGLLPARVTFTDGLWLHRGGTWRPNQWSGRNRPIIRRLSRALAEIERVAPHRCFDVVVRPGPVAPGDEGVAVDLPLDELGRMVAVAPDGCSPLPARTRDAVIAALLRAGADVTPVSAPAAEAPAQSQGTRPPVSGSASMRYS